MTIIRITKSPRRIKSRARRVTIASVVCLVVALNSADDVQPVTSDVVPPTPEEVAILEDLYEWIVGGTGELRAVSRSDMAAAIRSSRQSFDLFRSYHGEEQSRRIVQQMPYGRLIADAANRHRLDAFLLVAVIEAESGFNAKALSSMGAVGLMQVMPGTASDYGIHDPFEPAANVEVGARYLNHLLHRFDGDVELALAAYNAGPGAVDRFGGTPPYRETRTYVNRVLGRYVAHHSDVWDATRLTPLLPASPAG